MEWSLPPLEPIVLSPDRTILYCTYMGLYPGWFSDFEKKRKNINTFCKPFKFSNLCLKTFSKNYFWSLFQFKKSATLMERTMYSVLYSSQSKSPAEPRHCGRYGPPVKLKLRSLSIVHVLTPPLAKTTVRVHLSMAFSWPSVAPKLQSLFPVRAFNTQFDQKKQRSVSTCPWHALGPPYVHSTKATVSLPLSALLPRLKLYVLCPSVYALLPSCWTKATVSVHLALSLSTLFD